MGMHDVALRPEEKDPAVIEIAARMLAGLLADIRDDGAVFSRSGNEIPLDKVMTNLSRALTVVKKPDGLALMWVLEDRFFWAHDAKVAVVLGKAKEVLAQAFLCVTTKWVSSNSLQPKRRIGDAVSVRIGSQDFEAKVADILEFTAQYELVITALGVYAGNYIVVPYERIHELYTPPEEFQLSAQLPVYDLAA